MADQFLIIISTTDVTCTHTYTHVHTWYVCMHTYTYSITHFSSRLVRNSHSHSGSDHHWLIGYCSMYIKTHAYVLTYIHTCNMVHIHLYARLHVCTLYVQYQMQFNSGYDMCKLNSFHDYDTAQLHTRYTCNKDNRSVLQGAYKLLMCCTQISVQGHSGCIVLYITRSYIPTLVPGSQTLSSQELIN